MPLSPGARIGSYEIIAPIGAGGMGEVYRARDSKLDRDVAIKVLPATVAHDPERLARFEREAKTLAALNHSNIAHVYGVEAVPTASGTTAALVMELVEGQDLSQQIARGPMPLADALPIARQIADALEAAHEQGIVHRDLKPANIKVRPDGTVKVLDFGLAKAMDATSSAGQISDASTAMNSPAVTALGVILGTAAYMSPEQARGRMVDRRADIWAFGVVLYEMLTGKRLFAGDDVTEVLARVLEREPDWSMLPATTPPALRRLLERCLTKDPKARLRDIGEARVAIDDILAGRSGPTVAASVIDASRAPATSQRSTRMAWLPWLVASALALIAGAAWLRPASVDTAHRAGWPTRVELVLPDNTEFYTSPRISPDGRRIAFVGNRLGLRQIYVRNLDRPDTRALANTDGALFIVFSPDSKSVAFTSAEGHLKRLSLDNGSIEDLTNSVDIVGSLDWTTDNRILFGLVTKLAWVPSTGGRATDIVSTDSSKESSMVGAMATPDGKTILFTTFYGPAGMQRSRIEAVSMTGESRHVVVEDAGYLIAVQADRLLFQRGTAIYGAPFDPVRAVTTGAAEQLMDEARVNPTGGLTAAISPGGDLLFADTSTAVGRLSWVSLDGVDRAINASVRGYSNPRVSPDGRLVAYSDALSLWTTDVERGSQTKIFTGTDSLTGFPVWSADGRLIFFRSSSGVLRIPADGEGQPTLIKGSIRQDYPNSASPDGTMLAVTRILPETSGDVVLIPLTGGGEPRTVVSTPAYEGGAQFSPDGKWLTYISNASGHMEVYVRPVNGDTRTPVSTNGGIGALWSHDGRRIFYRNLQQFLAVDFTTTPTVQLSQPKVLFERRYAFGPNLTIANYSLSKDGKDFLLVSAGADHLSVIFNWLQSAGR